MAPDLFPFSPSKSRAARNLCRWRSFLRSNGALRIGFFTPFLLTGLLVYLTFFSPLWRLPNWHLSSHLYPDPLSPSSSPVSDVLTLEQIRDIVAPTRGLFSRDYSLYLGWNNVSGVFLHWISATNDLSTDAVYHRGCTPSGRTAESHLGYTFVRLRTRVRVQHVCDSFPASNQCSYAPTFPSSAALFARTMQLWSIRATLSDRTGGASSLSKNKWDSASRSRL
jgi:hypothetical protein